MKYSVCRIETAKQQCLKGLRWHKPKRKPSMLDNWTDDDERKLVAIFNSFDIKNKGTPTHRALNEAIDHVAFSGGVHAINMNLKDLIQIDYEDGRVGYKEYTKQWGFPA